MEVYQGELVLELELEIIKESCCVIVLLEIVLVGFIIIKNR